MMMMIMIMMIMMMQFCDISNKEEVRQHFSRGGRGLYSHCRSVMTY